ncbi:hypothetical protein DNK47_03325, partial [Mycoplasma wenyonii]
ERKKLGDLVTIVGGGTPSTKCPEYWTKEGGIPWIGISDLTANKGKFINKGEINITEEGKRNSSTRLISKNSILFSCAGTNVGKMGMNDKELCISQNFFGIYRSKYQENYYYWFLIKINVTSLQRRSFGTVINLISQKNFREFEVLLPPQKLIEKFNNCCKPFFQIQKTNEKEIRELLKLQKYFIELTN